MGQIQKQVCESCDGSSDKSIPYISDLEVIDSKLAKTIQQDKIQSENHHKSDSDEFDK